jgi:glycosyltransferase involved in cell wall biosynthesis
MPTLLQINSIINTGSTGRIAEEIGQLAVNNGWNSYIAYARNENASKSRKIKIGSKLDIYWHVFITRAFDRHGLGSRRATKKFIKQIQAIKPDIIHLHNIHGYFINYKMLFHYLSQADIPVVWTLHDCWAFTGHCSHFVCAGCNKWQDICFACQEKKTYPVSFLFDRSRRNFNDKQESFLSVKNLTLVPVSIWLKTMCSKSFFKETPCNVIQNGIDLEIFKPSSEEDKKSCLRKYNITADFIILGVASKWSTRKGFDDFISLALLLPDDCTVLLVGLSKKQISILPQNIIGISRTNAINDLVLLYSSADVFINPTWEDSFPTVNLEALACGTPVVTYNTGGSVEPITSETGYIVEQGDIEGLLQAIKTIKHNEKHFYSDNCRKRAVSLYNKRERYNEYLTLYNQLL